MRKLTTALLMVLAGARLAGAYQVELSWKPSAKGGVAEYQLYQRVGSRSSPVRATNRTGLTVVGLVPGRLYFFKVSALSRSHSEVETTREVGYFAKSGRKGSVARRAMAAKPLSIAVKRGSHYIVESSDDLKTWRQAADTVASSPTLTYDAASDPGHYIRIREQAQDSFEGGLK